MFLRLTFVPVVASLLLVRTAAASADKLDMSWQAPPGCPAYSDVESWLQAVIPPDARERLGELHVTVVIAGKAGSGFSASVRVTRDAAPSATAPSELRVVEGRACEEVARSAIVVVSVAMSDALKAVAPPAEAPPTSEPVREPTRPTAPARLERQSPPSADRAPPSTKPAPTATSLFTLAGGAGSGFAEKPGVRVDASALFALGRRVFVGPRVHALPSVTIRREDDVAALHLLAAGPELCALPELSASLHATACGRVEAGFAWSEGTRSGDPSDSGAVAALAVSPGLSIGRDLRVLIQGDLELRLLRPRFERADAQVLATLPILAASGLIGLSVAVP